MSSSAVRQYADRWLSGVGGEHAVWSPLGVWLLLALVAPQASGTARTELETILGVAADEAFARAAALLADPPEVVSAAIAAWADAGRLLPSYSTWDLPVHVERGPMPTQQAADQWARERTSGQIDHFPLTIGPDTRILLASALATDISWTQPLSPVPADELGGSFGALATKALRLTHGQGWQGIVDTEAAGLVGVAWPATDSGLEVLSVIAAPGVAPATVHRAAHEVAAVRWPTVADVTGDGHAWTLSTRREKRYSHAEVDYEWTSIFGAWRADSDHDLMDAPGVSTAIGSWEQFFRPEDLPVVGAARQSATAAFTREGFEAAAVTGFAAMAGSAAPPRRKVTIREVHLRFNRPYAVVARVTPDRWSVGEDWAGMPVFSAWVAEPDGG